MKTFQIDNSKYGKSNFKFRPKSRFFLIYFNAILVFIAVAVSLGFLIKFSIGALVPEAQAKNFLQIEAAVEFYLGVIALYSYIIAAIFNLVCNSIEIESLKTKSNASDKGLAWIYFSNLFARLFSLGLLSPWAKIRLARAKINSLKLVGPANSLDAFHAGTGSTAGAGGSAGGDAASDLMDIDFDFGF